MCYHWPESGLWGVHMTCLNYMMTASGSLIMLKVRNIFHNKFTGLTTYMSGAISLTFVDREYRWRRWWCWMCAFIHLHLFQPCNVSWEDWSWSGDEGQETLTTIGWLLLWAGSFLATIWDLSKALKKVSCTALPKSAKIPLHVRILSLFSSGDEHNQVNTREICGSWCESSIEL